MHVTYRQRHTDGIAPHQNVIHHGAPSAAHHARSTDQIITRQSLEHQLDEFIWQIVHRACPCCAVVWLRRAPSLSCCCRWCCIDRGNFHPRIGDRSCHTLKHVYTAWSLSKRRRRCLVSVSRVALVGVCTTGGVVVCQVAPNRGKKVATLIVRASNGSRFPVLGVYEHNLVPPIKKRPFECRCVSL